MLLHRRHTLFSRLHNTLPKILLIQRLLLLHVCQLLRQRLMSCQQCSSVNCKLAPLEQCPLLSAQLQAGSNAGPPPFRVGLLTHRFHVHAQGE
jgi:hypothetical protein